MARERGPIGKQSRRENFALHPKAHKLLLKKGYKPGQHGPNSRSRLSEYGQQLREKQRIRRSYGLLEKQFRILIKEAQKDKGQTDETILKLLELRLDNVIYRAGFSSSRRGARQLVSHGHITLDGVKNTVPSTRVKVGQIVEPKNKAKGNTYFTELAANGALNPAPAWLKVDKKSLKIEILTEPKREDVDEEFNEQAVVEFYSR